VRRQEQGRRIKGEGSRQVGRLRRMEEEDRLAKTLRWQREGMRGRRGRSTSCCRLVGGRRRGKLLKRSLLMRSLLPTGHDM
jgi:hypothetical protein